MSLKYLILSLLSFLYYPVNAQWNLINVDETQKSYDSVVKFKNDTLGIFMGSNSVVLKSINAGETWNLIDAEINVDIDDFQFVGDSVVYAVGESQLIKSEDLGENWELVKSFKDKHLYSVHFFDKDSGVVAGWDRIYRTIDAGISWDTVWYPQQMSFKWGGIKQMSFPSIQTGYAVGTGLNISGTRPTFESFILKSSNAGNTWDTIRTVPGELESIYFLNNDTGFMGRGSIFKTADGGESWTEAITSSTGYYAVNSIQFISDTIGFAVGAPTFFVPEGYTYFIVSKTTDGGDSWTSFYSTGLPLNSVYFLNDSIGFATGWYNLFMKSNGILDQLPENYPMHLADLDGVNVIENSLSEFEIQMYPNPTTGILYIKNLNLNNEIKKTILINTSGQIIDIQKPVIIDNQFIKLDLSALIPGIYMIKIEFSVKTEVMKIIKK